MVLGGLSTRLSGRLVAGGVWLGCLFLLAAVGCMTPDKAVRETEGVWSNQVAAARGSVTGTTNAYTFASPVELLRLRLCLLAETQGLHEVAAQLRGLRAVTGEVVVSNGVVRLSLADALRLAAKNDRKYQDHKQAIYEAALAFDTRQHEFETSFNGFLLGAVRGDPEAEQLTGQVGAGASRRFSNGATLTANLALNVAQLISGDYRSGGLSGDVSATIPLMRGSGREVVLEPMVQAERNLLYAVRAFEYYRQTYAVQVANGYFGVLETAQRIRNAEENERNLAENRTRAIRLNEAGRMRSTELDQASQNYLKATENAVLARQNYAAALDQFSVALGLPPGCPVELDPGELARLEQMMLDVDGQGAAAGAIRYPDVADAVRTALARRIDLSTSADRVADAERALVVAADALRPDLSLKAGASADRTAATGGKAGFSGDERWNAEVRGDLPWERRRERNAYRKALLDLEKSRRALVADEDAVRSAVRGDLRTLDSVRASYQIQKRAVRVAERRVDSNRLFQQAGRSQMRDVLEAQDALLAARNSFLSAVVRWRLTELGLRRDMGVLAIGPDGLWENFGGDEHDRVE